VREDREKLVLPPIRFTLVRELGLEPAALRLELVDSRGVAGLESTLRHRRFAPRTGE
jgi:hypothetical protein